MIIALAFLWGFSEATLFFIVPDVLLGWTILTKQKNIIQCYSLALFGAVLGGAVMYLWGEHNSASVNSILVKIPAIDAELIEKVRYELNANIFVEMIKGSLSGTPYKIYAANASSFGIDLGLFILLSIPARLIRWVLVGLFTWGAYKLYLHKFSIRLCKIIYLMFWLIFYSLFFTFK